MNANRKAFLDMIAFSEGTSQQGDHDGYDIIAGSREGHGIHLRDYSRHPFVTVEINARTNLWSTAAGRYQINHPTWEGLCTRLGLSDFSRDTQDAMALSLIEYEGALDDVDAGRIKRAIGKCANRWASFPGANYHQRENKMDVLLAAYRAAGGELND